MPRWTAHLNSLCQVCDFHAREVMQFKVTVIALGKEVRLLTARLKIDWYYVGL